MTPKRPGGVAPLLCAVLLVQMAAGVAAHGYLEAPVSRNLYANLQQTFWNRELRGAGRAISRCGIETAQNSCLQVPARGLPAISPCWRMLGSFRGARQK
jgi:predicted carbohydrate-binding protein with CBM5 and CBM33 domain